MYANPPVVGMDYDDAYNEAKGIFQAIFGQDEGFLMPEETSDDDAREDDGL
jgi:hypothetical protein